MMKGGPARRGRPWAMPPHEIGPAAAVRLPKTDAVKRVPVNGPSPTDDATLST